MSSTRPLVIVAITRRSPGFTLVELLVTLSILAISLAVAAPSLTQFLQRQAVDSATQALVADLKLARSEAVKRGVQVEVCGAILASDGTRSCTTAAANWSANGWMVRDKASQGLIRVQQARLGVGNMDATAGSFVFNPTGILFGLGGNVLINPISSTQVSDKQITCIGSTGRPRVLKGSNKCA